MKLTDADRKRAFVDMTMSDLTWKQSTDRRKNVWERSDGRYRIRLVGGQFKLYRVIAGRGAFVGQRWSIDDAQALSIVLEEQDHATLSNQLLEQLAKDGAIG